MIHGSGRAPQLDYPITSDASTFLEEIVKTPCTFREEIPLLARIFTSFSIFDAITSARPYRFAPSRDDAPEY